MASDSRDALRALALWHTRRRLVDELLDPLLEYGPAAVDRVAERLPQVQALVRDEQQAFEAFVEQVQDRAGASAVVLDLFPPRQPTDMTDS